MLKRLFVASLAIGLVACSSSDPVARPRAVRSPLAIKSHGPNDIEKTVAAKVDMKITGDENITFTADEMKLHIVEIFGSGKPTITHFFSVSSAEAVLVGEDRFLFTADLAPGSFKGYPGEYTISSKGVPPIAGRNNAIGGAAYVWVLHPKPNPIPKFDGLAAPCTLTIGEGALDGSVDCPKLTTTVGDKQTISLRWSWTVL